MMRMIDFTQQGIKNWILYTDRQYDQMTEQYFITTMLVGFLQEDVYQKRCPLL